MYLLAASIGLNIYFLLDGEEPEKEKINQDIIENANSLAMVTEDGLNRILEEENYSMISVMNSAAVWWPDVRHNDHTNQRLMDLVEENKKSQQRLLSSNLDDPSTEQIEEFHSLMERQADIPWDEERNNVENWIAELEEINIRLGELQD